MNLVVDQIGARDAWVQGITGVGVNVAVIDTGVANVPALRDEIVASIDFSADQIDPTTAYDDDLGHGTHLAGIIAGREAGADVLTDDGFFGVAPDAGIVSVKVAGGDGSVTLESVVTGIDWAIEHADEQGIRVITLALDTGDRVPYTEHALSAALERAWDAGIVVITGAGNDGVTQSGLSVPASDPFIISVGAVDMTASGPTTPTWTSRGDGIRNPDLAAPGAHIESLVAPGSDADLHHPEGRVSDAVLRGSGTSQSAAVVAGAAALLLQARPELTPDEVKHLLVESSATLDADPAAVGAGLLDVAAAIEGSVTDATQDFPRAAATEVPAVTSSPLFVPAQAGWSWAGNSWIGNSWIEQELIRGSAIAGSATAGSGTRGSAIAGSGTRGSGTRGSANVGWIGNSWIGNSWIGNSWIGNSWIGNSWIGNSWIGNSWIGNSWIGNSWIGNSWIGKAGSGTVIGDSWIGNSWIGNLDRDSWIGNS